MNQHYLDDFSVGDVIETPGVSLTEGEIVDFALKYDPQPFHLDRVAASQSLYGGLIASGFQTMALCFRMFIQNGILRDASMGSPGLDEVRWYAPVRPGDTLHTRLEVLEVTPSRSKPDRGIARIQYQAVNQNKDVVMSFIAMHMLKRKA